MEVVKLFSCQVRRYWLGLSVLFCTWGTYFMVFWPKMLYFNAEGDLTAGWRNIWADWALHLTMAHAFAYQPIWAVITNSPLYAGASLGYPFITNLFSGLLIKLGVDVITAFILPSFFFSLCLLVVLFGLGIALTRSQSKAILAISIFLTSGGLGFYYYFLDLFTKGWSWQLITYPPREYTHLKDLGYWWTTTLLAHLVPQRAFLLGMIWGSLVLLRLFIAIRGKFQKTTLNHFWLLGIFSGLVCFIHSHTLLVIASLSLWLFMWNLKAYKYWLAFALGNLLPCLLFVLFLKNSQTDFQMHILWGWLSNQREVNNPFFWFWIKNWGIILPLSIITLSQRWRTLPKSPSAHKLTNLAQKVGYFLRQPKYQFITGFMILFGVANVIVFQASNWDNAKIFLWTYLFFSFLVADWLIDIAKKSLLHTLFTVICILILTLSGGIDLIRVLNSSKESFVMINHEEISLAEYVKKHTHADALILTSDNHLNWIPVLTGRNIVLGYRGWLWSYGIDYSQREKEVKAIYQGKETALELIKNYGIDFVVIDDKTREDYASNESFFQENFSLFLTSPQYRMYKTSP